MHPLDSSLDTSIHERPKPPARRRSSLDNSSLSAPDAFRQTLSAEQQAEYRPGRQRRLSLNAGPYMNITFLATNSLRPRVDLDADFHDSQHSTTADKKSNTALDPQSNSAESSFDDDSSSSGGTFCDASVQEEANEEYLKKDLGASCFWSVGDASYMEDGEVDCEFDQGELEKHLIEIIAEDGLESGLEQADREALREAMMSMKM
jgi:hypothetical protein